MAENKNAKKAAAAAAPKVESTTTATPADDARKAKKQSRWTPATCMKAAKRFKHREEWESNAPSSYKAAVAKGWDKECCAHMTAAPAVKAASAKTKAPSKTSKVTAAKKSPAKLPRSA